jgi:hypothetical protein
MVSPKPLLGETVHLHKEGLCFLGSLAFLGTKWAHVYTDLYCRLFWDVYIYIHKQVNMDILNTRICIQIHIHIVGHCTKIPATTYLNLFDTSLTCGVA